MPRRSLRPIDAKSVIPMVSFARGNFSKQGTTAAYNYFMLFSQDEKGERRDVLSKIADAQIDFLSPSVHYANCFWEGMQARGFRQKNGKHRLGIFHPKDNFARLRESVNLGGRGYEFPEISDEEMLAQMARVCVLNGWDRETPKDIWGKEAAIIYLRPLVYFPHGYTIGLRQDLGKPELALAGMPFGSYLGKRAEEEGGRALLYDIPRTVQFPNNKAASNYQLSLVSKSFGVTYPDAVEIIFTGTDGGIVEGGGDNIAIIEGNSIVIAPPENRLRGITFLLVEKITGQIGCKIKYEPISLERMANADSAFVCGNAAGIVPVRSIIVPEGKGVRERKRLTLPSPILHDDAASSRTSAGARKPPPSDGEGTPCEQNRYDSRHACSHGVGAHPLRSNRGFRLKHLLLRKTFATQSVAKFCRRSACKPRALARGGLRTPVDACGINGKTKYAEYILANGKSAKNKILLELKDEFSAILNAAPHAQKKYGKLFVFVDELLDEDEITYLRKTAGEFERKRQLLQKKCASEDSPSFLAKGQLFMKLKEPKLKNFPLHQASLYSPLILPLRKKEAGVQVKTGEK